MKSYLKILSQTALYLLCLFSILGFFSESGYQFELFCNFRLEYAILSLGALLYFRRQLPQFFLALICLLINVYECVPYVSWTGVSQSNQRPALRILFANVRITNRDYGRLVSLVRHLEPQVAVFTEVDAEWVNQLNSLTATLPYSFVRPKNDKFGMALYSQEPLSEKQLYEFPGIKIPSVAFDVSTTAGGKTFRVIAAHGAAPVTELQFDRRNQMLNSLVNVVRSKKEPVVFVGDLNITPWSWYLKDFLRRTGLKDSRARRGIFPSWPVTLGLPLIPIDHCFYGSGVALSGFETTERFGSDHLGIVCDVKGRRF